MVQTMRKPAIVSHPLSYGLAHCSGHRAPVIAGRYTREPSSYSVMIPTINSKEAVEPVACGWRLLQASGAPMRQLLEPLKKQ